VVVGGLCLANSAFAGAFETYSSAYREVNAPAVGEGSFGVAGDAMADGRLLAVTGRNIFVETSVGSGVFEKAGEFAQAVVGSSRISGTSSTISKYLS
jgi:hypothetical protein